MKPKKILWLAIITVFIDELGFGILFPIMAVLLTSSTAHYSLLSPTVDFRTGYILFGFLVGTYSLAKFFAAPVLGQLSDHYGRKKILVFSLFGTAVSYFIFAIGILTRNIPLLFFSRALDGITGGNVSVAKAVVADITPPELRTKNFGLLGASVGLGFIIGPFLGGVLSNSSLVHWFNPTIPFWFAAILSLINMLSILVFLPETLTTKSPHLIHSWIQPLHNIRRAISILSLRVILMSEFLFHAGFTIFGTFFSVYLIRKFGFEQSGIGNFFGYIGLWIVFTQAVITGLIAKRFKERQVLKISFLALSTAILIFLAPANWRWLLLIAPFVAIFNGLLHANISGLISRSVDNSIQGEILGINASVQSLAQAFPPIFAGFIAASIGTRMPLILSAALIATAGFIFVVFYRPTTQIITD